MSLIVETSLISWWLICFDWLCFGLVQRCWFRLLLWVSWLTHNLWRNRRIVARITPLHCVPGVEIVPFAIFMDCDRSWPNQRLYGINSEGIGLSSFLCPRVSCRVTVGLAYPSSFKSFSWSLKFIFSCCLEQFWFVFGILGTQFLDKSFFSLIVKTCRSEVVCPATNKNSFVIVLPVFNLCKFLA